MLDARELVKLDHLEEVKTGNKVSEGEPTEGSVLIIPNGY